MKNSTLIMVIVGALIVGIVGVFLVSQKNDTDDSMMAPENSEEMMQPESEKMMEDTTTTMEGSDSGMMEDDSMMKEDTSMMKSGNYVPYSATALAEASAGRRVLYFYASWCPTCRPADADFSANLEKFPSDLTLVRVNYNDTDTDAEEKSLAEKYGITYQHTFVQIDADGNELARWNGGQTAELLANLK